MKNELYMIAKCIYGILCEGVRTSVTEKNVNLMTRTFT